MKKLGKRILLCVLTLSLAADPMAIPFSAGIQREFIRSCWKREGIKGEIVC